MVNKEKHVDDVLKKLEQGIEKIAEVFDQYTEAVRQEIAFINQRMTELESKVDGAASWSSYTGEKREARPISLGSREPADFVTAARDQTPPSVSRTPSVAAAGTPQGRQYISEKTYAASPREAEAAGGRSPSQARQQPARREMQPSSFGESSGEEAIGTYRPARGGIVEEKYVKPSVFSKEMNKLEAAAAATPQQYGPGGYPLPPSMQLRSQISTVLGKIKPEAQRRAPRPEPTPGYGEAPGYGSAPGYQAPSRPPAEAEYGGAPGYGEAPGYGSAPGYQAPRRPPAEAEYGGAPGSQAPRRFPDDEEQDQPKGKGKDKDKDKGKGKDKDKDKGKGKDKDKDKGKGKDKDKDKGKGKDKDKDKDKGRKDPKRPPAEEEEMHSSRQPASPAYAQAPPPVPAGEAKTISVPDNWLPDSSRAKYYNPKKVNKGDIKELEKKTKDIFKG
ncbi:MAG: hypothetical protein WED07_01635 [Candidatus Freyarchaeum deiterrae]